MTNPSGACWLARVKEILFQEWDPIGVNEYPQCRDEYDSYAPHICRLLDEGVDEYRLTQHLMRLADEAMGLPPQDEAHHRKIARLLLGLSRL